MLSKKARGSGKASMELSIDLERTFVISDHHFCASGMGAILNGTANQDEALHVRRWSVSFCFLGRI